jgi:hypothetical protein
LVLLKSDQSQVGVRAAADNGDSVQKSELTRPTAHRCLTAKREYEVGMAAAARVVRGRDLHCASHQVRLTGHQAQAGRQIPI